MKWFAWILPLFLSIPVVGQTILMEAPLSVDIAGESRQMMAFYDGAEFWVDPVQLAQYIGFEVIKSDSAGVLLRDANRAIEFQGSDSTIFVNNTPALVGALFSRGSKGEMLVSMSALQEAFDADMEWDPFSLTLRISTRATLFAPTTKEVAPPAKLLFPRERTLFGGMQIYYNLSHRWTTDTSSKLGASVVTSMAVGGGEVRVNASRSNPSVTYQIPFDKPWLTQVSVTWRQSQDMPSAILSNRPIVQRRNFTTRMIDGFTFPHAIVESSVGGESIERVQADRAGRYSVAAPIYYGTTRSAVEITPLGRDPLDALIRYELTPFTALPPKTFEYDLRYDRSMYAQLSYGVSKTFTVRAKGVHDPVHVEGGATVKVLESMYAEIDTDMLDQSTTALLMQWQDWGQWDVRYQYSNQNHTLTGSGVAQFGILSLGSRFFHQRRGALSSTGVSPSIGIRSKTGIEARLQSTISVHPSPHVHVQPNVGFETRTKGVVLRVTAGAEVSQSSVKDMRSDLMVSKDRWHLSIGAQHEVDRDATNLRASLQVSTDWAWLGTNSDYIDGRVSIDQNARGAIGLGRRITFSATHRENAQAVFRFFEDTNLNGELDDLEKILHGPSLQVGSAPLLRRFSGDLVTSSLTPDETYTVTILPATIVNPLLHPLTGYRFAFIAQAGRTREIDIALQPLSIVTGMVQGWEGANELLVITISSETIEQTLDVYRDGGFFTQIPSGTYILMIRNILTNEVLYREARSVGHNEGSIIIQIPPQ